VSSVKSEMSKMVTDRGGFGVRLELKLDKVCREIELREGGKRRQNFCRGG
jgi:hypothetical protein